MSLYKKYRPEEFAGIVGNEDIVEYLESTLQKESEEWPHAILLHGSTGCGKTTLARIIAGAMDCDSLDLKEINTANFRGIDTVRDMIKHAGYKAIAGDSRVWVIDEVHKMTNDAQNALLKLLEDSPSHAYFILCTTEPEKLLPTIKGRCMQLQVKSLTDRQMFKLLKSVTKKEEKKLKTPVYDQIIQDSFGLPRNALQILERVLGVPKDQQLEIARQSAIQYSESIELCRALIGSNGWKKISSILKGLKDQEAESIRRHVLGYCQSVLLNGGNDKAAQVIEEFWEPLYNIGFPGLVFACYSVTKGK